MAHVGHVKQERRKRNSYHQMTLTPSLPRALHSPALPGTGIPTHASSALRWSLSRAAGQPPPQRASQEAPSALSGHHQSLYLCLLLRLPPHAVAGAPAARFLRGTAQVRTARAGASEGGGGGRGGGGRGGRGGGGEAGEEGLKGLICLLPHPHKFCSCVRVICVRKRIRSIM